MRHRLPDTSSARGHVTEKVIAHAQCQQNVVLFWRALPGQTYVITRTHHYSVVLDKHLHSQSHTDCFETKDLKDWLFNLKKGFTVWLRAVNRKAILTIDFSVPHNASKCNIPEIDSLQSWQFFSVQKGNVCM
jgi:hypothetical protein